MKVSDEVLAVLDRADIDDRHLRIVEQLDRKLYVETNKVLEAAGGKWNRGAKAHVFGEPAVDALDQVLLTGEITTRQEVGYFWSPPPVVERLLELAEIEPGMSVLEPSAGQGAIAGPAAAAGARLWCVEFVDGYAEKLRDQGLGVETADFLTVEPQHFSPFDRVVMNPPFARQADVAHVQHALKFLADRGRLVTVMSNGVTFRANRATVEFREMVAERGGWFEPLPDDAFKPSGTSVRTVIAVIPNRAAA